MCIVVSQGLIATRMWQDVRNAAAGLCFEMPSGFFVDVNL
jgi:hypothetical protein